MVSKDIIGVILAGGQSRRMGSMNKVEAELAGERLIDRAFRKLSSQVSKIIISGPSSYGLNIPHVPDGEFGPPGPAAGIFAAREWAERNAGNWNGCVTIPVDGPFFPRDVAIRLTETGTAAVATDEVRIHPTYAFYRFMNLDRIAGEVETGQSLSLHRLSELLHARRVEWADMDAFFNINTQADLHAAERKLIR